MTDRSRYDAQIIALRKNLNAAGVLLVVLDGRHGSGSGDAVLAERRAEWCRVMPAVLREIANTIENGGAPGELRFDDGGVS